MHTSALITEGFGIEPQVRWSPLAKKQRNQVLRKHVSSGMDTTYRQVLDDSKSNCA
jgi:hypothetical protein